MKRSMIMTLGLLLSLNSMGSTIAPKQKDGKEDPRVIRIEKANDGLLYFSLCQDPSGSSCQSLNKTGFTQKEIEDKANSENNKLYGKGTAIGFAAVTVGAVAGVAVSGSALWLSEIISPIVSAVSGKTVVLVSETVAAALGIATGLKLGAGTGVITTLALGRSPIAHHKNREMLRTAAIEDNKMQVKNIDDAARSLKEVLSEIEEDRHASRGIFREIANLWQGDRQIGKEIPLTGARGNAYPATVTGTMKH